MNPGNPTELQASSSRVARWRDRLPVVEQPVRLAIFAAAAVAAVVVGFFAVSPTQAEKLIANVGYYYMLGLFGAWVWLAAGLAREKAPVWQGWWRRPGWAGVVLVAGSAVALWLDDYKHKILFDEYVLQGTAFHMHATKEIGTTIRAYDIQGTWLPIDTFLDKRPYFFTFLLSLLHDLTGFRIANAFVLNSLLTPVCLGLLYWLARQLAERGPALLAVALTATLPLFGQQTTGAGMELHNLTMLLVVAVTATLYLRVPDARRLGLLVVSTVLLAQSRYESVIFVGPVAFIIALGWWRSRRVLLPWLAVLAPLLLVPYAWHNRVVAATPLLWQLGKDHASRFSTSYLPGNLEGAWAFFFNFGGGLANSWYLSALGAVAVAVLLALGWRAARRGQLAPLGEPAAVAALAVAAGIVANVVLLQFYYWSRFDDVVASRFALPLCVALAVAVAVAVARVPRVLGWRTQTLAGLGLLGWAVGWGVPMASQRLFTAQNMVMQEVEWEYSELQRRDPSVLLITNKSTIPFVLWRIPAVINGQGRQRGPQIAFHLRQGTFREVIVVQALRPTSAEGELGVAPEDLMPPEWKLETIAEKRFGARWSRLSRLVEITAKPTAPATAEIRGTGDQ